MHSFGHAAIFLYLHLSETISRILPICGVVSILARVNLLENTEVNSFSGVPEVTKIL